MGSMPGTLAASLAACFTPRGVRQALVATGLLAASGAAAVTPGALTQLPDPDACVSHDGSGGDCTDGKALQTPTSVAIAPDGKHVYVAATGSDAVAAFRRDRATGALTQLAGPDGCVSDDGTGGVCGDGTALVGPVAAAVSNDGRHVYVGSQASHSVAAFARNKATGALSQLAGQGACVSADGTSGACAVGKALQRPYAIAISPDGKHVYVASEDSYAVAAFRRNKTTGALTQLAGQAGCVSDDGTGGECADGNALREARALAISKDGKHVYVAAEASNAVAIFRRNKTTGALTQLAGTAGCVSQAGANGCAAGEGLVQPVSVALSQDGKHLYVASLGSGAVAVFRRDSVTGELIQLAAPDACVSHDGTGGACATGVALEGARAVAVSRNGKHVYVAAQSADAVAVFARDTTTGAITQLASPEGCVSADGSGGACETGLGLDGARAIAVSKDNKHVYVGSHVSDAVAAFARQR